MGGTVQAQVDREPRREVTVNVAGAAEIESYTVAFGEKVATPTRSHSAIYAKPADSGTDPSVAHLACRQPDGRRTWANIETPEVLDAMCHEEFCGRTVRIDGQGTAVLT